MAQFEYEFSDKDRELVLNQQVGEFGGNDYIRIIVYPTEGLQNIVRLPETDDKAIFYSSLSETLFNINISPFYSNVDTISVKELGNNKNDFKIYKNGDNIYIKPNDIFDNFQLPQGSYKIQVDFLNQVIEKTPDISNTNLSTNYLQSLPFPQYLEEFDLNEDGYIFNSDAILWGSTHHRQRPDIESFIQLMLQGGVDSLHQSQYIFPENFYNSNFTLSSIPIGGTNAQLTEIFNNPTVVTIEKNYEFIIKQISTSRKEVRLKLLDKNIVSNSNIITDLTNEFNQDTDKYQFKHLLNIGTGDHVPIMNFTFDKFTDGRNNQSLILKLYESLPQSIENLSLVTIEKEVLTTQVEEIFYFSEVPDVYFGDGLSPQPQEDWINSVNNEIGFENYNTLSGSIDDITLDNLISSSEYNYPNLNTDFNHFKNHTFFGSAKKKLENFKTKVTTIQSYYTNISSSLTVSSSIDGDSSFIIQYRKNLFNKINEEFKTFTPYERFLYYNGQNESTASAPSLGKNYADTIPVQANNIFGFEQVTQLNQHNGFNVVYKHSSEMKEGPHTSQNSLFREKYKVQNKPFFNYSSSIYLSFLMQADSGSGKLEWINNNEHSNPPFPHDTLYQNNILNPDIGDVSSSIYKRYIFEASQSYFVPNQGWSYDLQHISNFGDNSNQITVLHGTKEASYQIIDSTGNYPTTVVTASGAPFKGSVMPAGELFRILHHNTLSSSLLGYYDYVDADIVTGGNDFEILDKSGNKNTLEFGGVGSSPNAFTSASITTGVQGGDAFAFTTTGSNAEDQSGSMFLTTANSTALIESAPISMSAVAGDTVTGFTMATYYKSTSTKANATIMSMDIKSGSTDVNGWNIQRLGNTIGAEVTREGVNILDNDTSADGLKTGTLTPKDGNFHHIAMTYDNITGTGSMFFDGVLQKQGNARGFITGSNQIYRLIVGSGPGSAQGYDDDTFDETRFYTRALTPSEINQLYLTPDGITETKITDVKVTLKNPSDVLPFDNVYKTTSTEWTSWYNDMLTKAETFDTDNIHSFENNLPLYIQESSDYSEMKTFLNLQGEQYDLIRNHIDSLGTIHNRGYKKTDSPPENILPILLNNIGYESINPFSGNLTETLGSYLSGVTSIDDIKNQTWRKTLNNLLYIYKSKGTKNAVRGLLNTYGYPPDVLEFQEFGGTTENVTDSTGNNNPVFSDSPPPPASESPTRNLDLDTQTGSIGFQTKTEKLYNYSFSAKDDRKLNLDWWMGEANANTIELVYKHRTITNTQTILKSSGSGAETLWDLRVKPSADGVSSSFEFRLNNSLTGSLAIASNGISMSSDYSTIGQGKIINLMLQRITGSTATNITNEYRLHSTFQDGKSIETYNYITMSVAGASSTNELQANQNFIGSGSRHALSSSNLVVGENFSGSLAEIRAWSSALSKSKFEQHTFNKFATVGNTLNSYKDELIYRFKLNENYTSSSISSSAQSVKIIDSSPTATFKDYSFTKSGTVFNVSNVYGFNYIDVVRLTLQDNINKPNDNNIIVNPRLSVVGNLSSDKSALGNLTNPLGEKPLFKTSDKLELYRSPQTYVNNFILDNLSGFNLEKLYGNPINYYSQSYSEFDTFRENFFDAHPITVDINKFIRAHENIFNDSINEALQLVVPARSTFGEKSSIGVEVKPTILEKQKYENENHSVETNPHLFSASINPVVEPPVVTQEKPKSGSISTSLVGSGSLGLPYTASIGRGYIPFDAPSDITSSLKPSTSGSRLILPISTSISTTPTTTNSELVLPKSGSFDNQSAKSFVNIHDSWGRGIDDTHFINFAAPTSSINDYNVLHIDKRSNYVMIGDTEIYSGSKRNQTDFTNFRNFHNRRYISTDVHSGVTYESYINGNPGNQTGRMIGKTLYYLTGSDGSITLPSNHIDRYSYPFNKTMYEGTQNTNPGLLNGNDLSTSSFYRVKVTGGEQAIYVKGTNNPTRGGGDTDKIIY